jgi:hypothetical protein
MAKVPTAGALQGWVKDTLSTLLARNGSMRILVMSVPDWGALWDAHEATIRSKWEERNLCPLLRNEATESDLKARLAGYNTALENACDEFFANCRFDDGRANALRFNPAVDLSTYDMFHPNETGQGKLAGATWDAGWFADIPPGGETLMPARLVLRFYSARLRSGGRVRVNAETFPGAAVAVRVRNSAGNVIGRFSTRADSLGDVVRTFRIRGFTGRVARVTLISRWEGQRRRATLTARR